MALATIQKAKIWLHEKLSSITTLLYLTEDIAHQQERVHEALIKLERLFVEAEIGRAAGLRLIVGSGLIREAVFEALRARQFRGDILGYGQDGQNSGAIFVKLR